jgi:hypothetical protein
MGANEAHTVSMTPPRHPGAPSGRRAPRDAGFGRVEPSNREASVSNSGGTGGIARTLPASVRPLPAPRPTEPESTAGGTLVPAR